jgi:Fe-S-cluster-containing hydrogenase component 2
MEEARDTPRYSIFDALHGYVYARWPYLYIGTAKREHPITRFLDPVIRWLAGALWSKESGNGDGRTSFADSYHGKVVPLDAAAQLVTIKEDISLTDLEHVVPHSQARDIVLKNPDHIVALECPCRAYAPNPCKPLDVCLIVGEPFAGFVAEHHPRRSRWITSQEAIDILRAEDERGHAHHAFFKDAMFGRFYAICNCCDCCCGSMLAHQNGVPMLASSGYVCGVDADLCIGCATCTESCPFGALSMDNGVATIDAQACMGCGVCLCQCTQEALSLARDPARGEPLEIHRLIEGVASPEGVASLREGAS